MIKIKYYNKLMIMDTNSILIIIIIVLLLVYLINQMYYNNSIENFEDNDKESVINPTEHNSKLNNSAVISIVNLTNDNNDYKSDEILKFSKAGNLKPHEKYLGHNISKYHPDYEKNVKLYNLYSPIEKFNREPESLRKIYSFRDYDMELLVNIDQSNQIDLNYPKKDDLVSLANKQEEDVNNKINYIQIDINNGNYFFDFNIIINKLKNKFDTTLKSVITRDIIVTFKNTLKEIKPEQYFKVTRSQLYNYFKDEININMELIKILEDEGITNNKLYFTDNILTSKSIEIFGKKVEDIFKSLQNKINNDIKTKIRNTTYFVNRNEDDLINTDATGTIDVDQFITRLIKDDNLAVDFFDSTLNQVPEAINKDAAWNEILTIKQNAGPINFINIIKTQKGYNPDNFYYRFEESSFTEKNKINLDKKFKDIDIYIISPEFISNKLIDILDKEKLELNKNPIEYSFKKIKVINKLQIEESNADINQVLQNAKDDKAFKTISAPAYTIYRPVAPDNFTCVGDIICKNGESDEETNVNKMNAKKEIMCIPISCYVKIRSWREEDRVCSIYNFTKKKPLEYDIVNFFINPFTNTFTTTIGKNKLPSGYVGRISKCPDVTQFDDVISLINNHKRIVAECKAEKELDKSIPIKSNDFDLLEQNNYLNNIYKQEQKIKFLKQKASQMLLQEQNAEISKREKNRQDLQSHIEKQRQMIEKGLMKLRETQNQVDVNISYPLKVVENVIQLVKDSDQPIDKKIEIIKKLKEVTDTPDYKDKINRILQSCPDLNTDGFVRRDSIPCHGCNYEL